MEIVSNIQRSLFASMALLFMFILASFVRSRRMDLRHALVWLPAALGVFLVACFPQSLIWFSERVGFRLPSNAAMSLGLMGLLFVVFVQSVAISRSKQQIRQLAQRIALFEERQGPKADGS